MKQASTKHLLLMSDICLIMVAALWGSSYGVAKHSLQFYPVFGFLAIRFGLSSLLLAPFLLKHKDWRRVKQSFSTGMPLGVILLIIFMCETFGVLYTSASNAAFLISLCLIFTPFLEWFLLKNRPSGLVFICASVSLIGTYLLTLQLGKSSVQINIGDGFILMAALFRGLMVVMTKKRLENKQVSSLHLTAVQSIMVFIGSLFLFISTQIIHAEPIYFPDSEIFWISSLYLVVFCTIFAFFIQNWAIKIGSPSRASLLMGSEPVFGAIFAVILFGEHISAYGWIGGAMITLSSILLILNKK